MDFIAAEPLVSWRFQTWDHVQSFSPNGDTCRIHVAESSMKSAASRAKQHADRMLSSADGINEALAGRRRSGVWPMLPGACPASTGAQLASARDRPFLGINSDASLHQIVRASKRKRQAALVGRVGALALAVHREHGIAVGDRARTAYKNSVEYQPVTALLSYL